MSYVTGSHNAKVGIQYQRGTFFHTYDANGDLYQIYRSSSTKIPYSVPDTVLIRNTPITTFGERLNYDVGVYVQDTWTLRRLTVTAGLRYEWLNAQVEPADSPAGRFVPARHFDAIKNLPDWHDPAPRFSMVYDVFGNAKTALKYSLNRYNQSRTTGIAANYNPLISQTATLRWTDVNHDDIAQGQLGFNADGSRQPLCSYPSVGCEINLSSLSSSFGVRAPNEYGAYPRTWNVESGLEVQHELLPRLSITGSWFHGSFHNLTTTINQSWAFDGDPTKNPNYVPMTIYNALTGEPIAVYSRTLAAQQAPTRNLDTFDPNREQVYNSYNLEFRARPGGGAQIFGGFAFERQLTVNCTTPDNPNSLRFCDDTQNDIPFSKQFKLAGSYPLAFGIQLSGAFQSNQGSSSSQTMVITRGATKYPANCPAPCPAGSVILPSTFQPASLTVNLLPTGQVFTERINQLDFKVARTFRAGRFTVQPQFEMFNVNNSDAIVSYVTTNTLSSSYGYANSILQPRMIGVGAQVRW
jgi:hypothetical protein